MTRRNSEVAQPYRFLPLALGVSFAVASSACEAVLDVDNYGVQSVDRGITSDSGATVEPSGRVDTSQGPKTVGPSSESGRADASVLRVAPAQSGPDEDAGGDAGACNGCFVDGRCISLGTSSELPPDSDAGPPRDSVEALCECLQAPTRMCDQHTGAEGNSIDGVGICRAGTQTCISDDKPSSEWSSCSGAVAPAPRDCSSSADNDCDGKPDNTIDDICTCVTGTLRACEQHSRQDGSSIDGVGSCRAGVQFCAASDGQPGSAWSPCIGAVAPAPRNCTSSADNDCDGRPDDTIDDICTCLPGTSQACGTHPGLDGHGPCRAGLQLCVGGVENRNSNYGACAGAVDPALQDSCAPGDDSDCDGFANDTCFGGSAS